MNGFTDYHAHFVYGVDDGAQTREELLDKIHAFIEEVKAENK